MSKVIVIEDSPTQLEDICEMLNNAGFETIEACSVKSGKEAVGKASPMDIVLADMRLPDGQCFEILYWMKAMGYHQPFLVMSKWGNFATSLTAINNGAAKFIRKEDLKEQLIPFVTEQMERLKPLSFMYDGSTYERQSEPFRKLREDLQRYAMLGFRLMLVGEVGAGKHSLAKLYHAYCERTGEFVRLDCASLTDMSKTALLLFGQEKDVRHPSRSDGGLLEKAKGGTVMLENVDCLPDFAQKMLLHVLQGNTYKPVGGIIEKPADVMFIATMNILGDSSNPLRLDFLHYLRNREVCVPPLRECAEDIIPLTDFFVKLFAKEKYLSAEAKSLLMAHKWTGNVHELKTAVRDAVSKSKGNAILPADFTLEDSRQATSRQMDSVATMELDDYLRIRIAHVLNTSPSFTSAASILKMSRNTLYGHIERLGLKNPFAAK